MQAINLIELIPRCHAGSRAKGFWDVTRPEREARRLLRQARRLVGFFENDPPMHPGFGS